MAAWIKMSRGMEVGLGPGDFVLDGDPAPPPQKGAQLSPLIFGPYLLRPNGCMDQDVTWYGGRPPPRRLCVRWRPRSLLPKGGQSLLQILGPCLFWPNGWMDEDGTWRGGGPQPGDFVLDGDPAPLSPKGAQTPSFWPISVAAKWLHGSRCHLVWS